MAFSWSGSSKLGGTAGLAAPSTGNLFGTNNTAQNQSQTQPNATGIGANPNAGNNQMGNNLGAGLSTAGGAQTNSGQVPGNMANMSHVDNQKNIVSLEDKLQRIIDAWDPQSPSCRFHHYFYERVNPELAAAVTVLPTPPGHNREKWEAALAARPDENCIPVLATGFSDLEARRSQQEQKIAEANEKLRDIQQRLQQLKDRHSLNTAVRLSKVSSRAEVLADRAMSLAVKLQVRVARSVNLLPEEQDYNRRLLKVNQKINDPSFFGVIDEVRARLDREASQGLRVMQQQQVPQKLEWARDLKQLEQAAEVLEAHQKGIKHLNEILEQDEQDVDSLAK